MSVFEGTLFELIKEVVKSWQVLAVTGVLVFYIFLVNRAARTYRRRKVSKSKGTFKFKKKKAKVKTEEIAITEEESGGSSSTNDELGLEE